MMGRVSGLRLTAMLAMLGAAAGSACTGGCYLEADPVRVSPRTPCLDLFAGHSRTEPGVCGAPDLKGRNECAEPLILPPNAAGGEPTRVEPGQEIFLNLDAEVPPGIEIRSHGDESQEYLIQATLGDQSILIVISVHED